MPTMSFSIDKLSMYASCDIQSEISQYPLNVSNDKNNKLQEKNSPIKKITCPAKFFGQSNCLRICIEFLYLFTFRLAG